MRTAFLVKPVSGACGLACRYCVYRGEGHARGRMSDETADALIRRALDGADGAAFAFQGGEPTLAGPDFFRRFAEKAERIAAGRPLDWSIQTNGTAVDDEFAAFLAEKRFLVGVSLDGPPELHDRARPDGAGNGSAAAALDAARRLRRAGADVNVLTVVTGETCRRAEEVWAWLTGQGFGFLQFILCLENDAAPHGCSPTEEEYAGFLIRTFSLWKAAVDRGAYVSVRYFDNVVGAILGAPPELCPLTGRCTAGLVVEADGSVYPCDFYVDETWRMGNVRDESVAALLASDGARRFAASRPGPDAGCAACRWRRLCGGGCRREFRPGGTRSAWCGAYRRFFETCIGGLTEVAAAAAAGRIRSAPGGNA